jgi:hypothetical protein
VVDFAFAAPEEWNCGAGKDLLRAVAAPLLPPEVCARPKQGYLAPDVTQERTPPDGAPSRASAGLFRQTLSMLASLDTSEVGCDV